MATYGEATILRKYNWLWKVSVMLIPVLWNKLQRRRHTPVSRHLAKSAFVPDLVQQRKPPKKAQAASHLPTVNKRFKSNESPSSVIEPPLGLLLKHKETKCGKIRWRPIPYPET
jgi:hypothetical protein